MGRTSDARERLMSAMMELIWAGSYGATSVEGICERAGVRKGSFYYFFESKTALAAAALEAGWEERRGELGKVFGEGVGPVERLRRWSVGLVAEQREMWERTGRVLGCPLHVLGAEISTQEEGLRRSIEKILGEYQGYVAAAILAAWGGGEERAMEAAARARRVFAYGEGLLTQARIANDPGLLDEMEEGVLAIALVRPVLQMVSSEFVGRKEDSATLWTEGDGSFSRFLCCSSVANPDSRPPRAVDSEKIPRP